MKRFLMVLMLVILLALPVIAQDTAIGNPAAWVFEDMMLTADRGGAWEVGYADGPWNLTAARGILVVKRLSGRCEIERISPRKVSINGLDGCYTKVRVITPRKQWQVDITSGAE